jgi:hypothetical protein
MANAAQCDTFLPTEGGRGFVNLLYNLRIEEGGGGACSRGRVEAGRGLFLPPRIFQ